MNLKKTISLILVSLAVLGALGTAVAEFGGSSSDQAVYKALPGSLKPVADVSTKTDVAVGPYTTNVYELSFEDNTFYFSGYVWLRWKGDADPASTLEFSNAVETWGLTVTPLSEKPETLADGSRLQTLSVQGRFYKTFPLTDYPLDKQTLSIMLEDSTNTAGDIAYHADADQSGLDSKLRVQGFEVLGMSTQKYLHNYGTDFGQPKTAQGQTYPALEFQIHIKRNANLFFWKLLTPLLLVLITNWLTLLINPRYVEVRTAMPATALLTMVFLQLSAADAVSQASTLVLMDKVYLVAFAAIVLTLGQVIWDNTVLKSEHHEHVESLASRDRMSLVVQFVITAVLFIALVAPHLR